MEDDEKASGKGKEDGIGGLIQHHRRMMQEAALDRQWEMVLLKAQLKDAEDQINELEKELHHDLSFSATDQHEQVEGKWSPSSLLSLRRVCMQCQPGEFVAVVGAVGAGKVSSYTK